MKKALLAGLLFLSFTSLQAQEKKESKQERQLREWKEEFPEVVEEIQLPTATYLTVFIVDGHKWIMFDPESGEKTFEHSPGCDMHNNAAPVNLYRPNRIPALPPYLGLNK